MVMSFSRIEMTIILWKRDIVQERFKEMGDVSLEYYEDEGNYISLNYSSEIESESVEALLNDVKQLYEEIDGATEIALGSLFPKIKTCYIGIWIFALLFIVSVIMIAGHYSPQWNNILRI